MKVLAKTREGLEKIGKQVILEQTKKIANIHQPGILTFTTTQKELNKLVSKPRCFTHIYELIEILPLKGFNKIKKIDFSKIEEPFRTICRKKKGGNLSSMDIEQEIGQHIYKKFKKQVNLKDPKTVILIEIVNDFIYIGKNDKGKLSKREYRIKTNNTSLPGDVAYSMLKIAKWKPSQTLLDPFCQTGEIVIEAAIDNGKKIYATDPNPFQIKKANFNAAVAEVDEKINFDTKPKQADKIITNLPRPNKFTKANQLIKRYKEFFEEAKTLLKKTGTITLLENRLLQDIPKDAGFKEIKTLNILSGEYTYKITTFKK